MREAEARMKEREEQRAYYNDFDNRRRTQQLNRKYLEQRELRMSENQSHHLRPFSAD
jgi:hypothetical protein